MNKVVCTLVTASILVSGSAFAQDRTKSTIEKHSGQSLRDTQMDNVTAGSAIAVGGGTVTTSNTGSVNLSGSALGSATGVNIVTSSDSLVGNGFNIYASGLTTEAGNRGTTVNQVNIIKQTQDSDAKISVAAKVDDVATAAAAARATNIAADGSTIATTNNYSVDLSGAAEQDAKGVNIVNASGGMVANGVNLTASSNIDAVPTLNQINIVKQSGLTSGSAIAVDDASVTTNSNGSVDLSGSALSGAFGLNIVNAANSSVANGTNIYNSTLDSHGTSNGSTVNQVNAFSQTEKTNAVVAVAAQVVPPLTPVELDVFAAAKATNVAVDSANINTTTNNSVDLAGSAEQNAVALNIVNAAGGIVSNGINIAHTSNFNSLPTLTQVNTISQVR